MGVFGSWWLLLGLWPGGGQRDLFVTFRGSDGSRVHFPWLLTPPSELSHLGLLWSGMPKGVGHRKGKQPAKKGAVKRPAPPPGGAPPAADEAGQLAILAQLEALKRAHELVGWWEFLVSGAG